jgi:hypothetical protein
MRVGRGSGMADSPPRRNRAFGARLQPRPVRCRAGPCARHSRFSVREAINLPAEGKTQAGVTKPGQALQRPVPGQS